MEEETRASTYVHIEGPSEYHCDQKGDLATIRLGRGFSAALTASAQDFLTLAEVCREAAFRIKMKIKEEAPVCDDPKRAIFGRAPEAPAKQGETLCSQDENQTN